MPVKVNFSDDTESKLGRYKQALTMNDYKIKIQACDGTKDNNNWGNISSI